MALALNFAEERLEPPLLLLDRLPGLPICKALDVAAYRGFPVLKRRKSHLGILAIPNLGENRQGS